MKSILFVLMILSIESVAQNFPLEGWMQYASTTDAGFSSARLEEVKAKHRELGGGALLVVYDGNIVLAVGDVSRKFMDHSMRKSYMSAVIGIHEARGEIKLDETLAAVGLDDIQPLMAEEKTATIADLLSAKSGVYHPSAYSPRGMAEQLPTRGSHAPGNFWYYNNWDFNVLATIFKQKTQLDFFQAFKNDIATPLQMEDFRIEDTFYRYEEISNHPAYLFRLSARDEARFGLMYMNNGTWNGKQVVPQKWVEKSTSAITTELTNFDSREGYGYLWWTTQINGIPGYYASGSGGQRIAIFPSKKIVIVQSTDTYDGSKNIEDSKIDELIKMILEARSDSLHTKAKLIPFKTEQVVYPNFKIVDTISSLYVGEYQHRFFGKMSIKNENGLWFLYTTSGTYRLHPLSNTEFIPEDIRIPIEMIKAEAADVKGVIKPNLNNDKSLKSIRFFY